MFIINVNGKTLFTNRTPQAAVSYDNIKRSLFRRRNEFIPPNAKNVEDIVDAYNQEEILNEFGTSKVMGRFFKTAFQCDEFSYCLFASDTIVDRVSNRIPVDQRVFLMDATFKIVPFGQFNQILIIYAAYMERHVVPFIWVLMSSKRQKCYEHVLLYIKSNVMSLDGKMMMTDYEKAMRNAIRGEYPNVDQRNCWFHFCQAVKRNASKNAGFIHLIQSSRNERTIYYKLMCLPLLPVEHIEGAFNRLVDSYSGCDAGFKKFLDYYRNQWIIKVIEFDLSISLNANCFYMEILLCYRKSQRIYVFVICASELPVHWSLTTNNLGCRFLVKRIFLNLLNN